MPLQLKKRVRRLFSCHLRSLSDVARSDPTRDLFKLAKRESSDVRVVQQLVKAGADVTYCPPKEETSLPSYLLFARAGLTLCFKACLLTRKSINFSQPYLQWTFHIMEGAGVQSFWLGALIYVCVRRTPEQAHQLLQAIIDRLEKRIPGDEIDWENVFNSEKRVNFVTHAAGTNLLHVVWPLLKNLPHFRRIQDPISILSPVCESDWAQLSKEDQARFKLHLGFVDDITAELSRLSLQYPIDVEAVRQCVRSGAHVQQRSFFYFHPMVYFLYTASVQCIAVCMETPHPLDFTANEMGKNVWVCIGMCLPDHGVDSIAAMLKVVIKRIAEDRPGDKVDWEQRDSYGHDFFAYAAEYDLLHVVWPIVKELPHFQNKQEPIPITRRITLEDWDQLSEEDQQRFAPLDGFVGKAFRIRSDRFVFRESRQFIERAEDVSWKKLREIGRGAFGVVYLGQLENGDLVAVKVPNLHYGTSSSNERNRMLLDEMEIMKHLRHKNVVEFYGAKSVPYANGGTEIQIFMEYCPGIEDVEVTLAELVRMRREMFTISVVRSYTKQILDGVAYLHRNKVVHRDLKPENVLLTADGVAKLTDFGCSKSLKMDDICQSMAGTPMFLAPEILDAKKRDRNYGAAVDIWSLGCTVIMLLGRSPWSGVCHDEELMWAIAYSNELPIGIPDPCPKDLHDFLTKCFNRDASKRWTAEQLLQHRWMTCAESELEEVRCDGLEVLVAESSSAAVCVEDVEVKVSRQ